MLAWMVFMSGEATATIVSATSSDVAATAASRERDRHHKQEKRRMPRPSDGALRWALGPKAVVMSTCEIISLIVRGALVVFGGLDIGIATRQSTG